MTPTRVFIVAPTPTLRTGLRSMLAESGEGAVEVIGASAGPPAGFAGEESAFTEADVVLVAEGETLEDLSFALSDEGTQSVVLLSGEEDAVAGLRAAGIAGMLRGWGAVPPDAPPEELEAAVLAAAQGLVVLPRDLSERLLGTPSSVEEPSEPEEPLTPREREVLGLLGRGFSNKLIARELHISEHTVKFHVSSLYAKLGVAGRTGAVAQGARRGLISL